VSNVDFRYGLKPIENLNGAPWNGATRRCRVDATAGDLFIGDPVVWNGSGYLGYPEVIEATAGDGNRIFGVITSFEPQPDHLDRIYLASADSGWANVCCDPHVIYSIQGCSGVALDSDAIGLNAVIIKTHSGSTVTGLSGVEMDSGATTAPAADASYQLLIIGMVDREDNDLDAINADWKVLINLSSLVTGGVGGGGTAEGTVGV